MKLHSAKQAPHTDTMKLDLTEPQTVPAYRPDRNSCPARKQRLTAQWVVIENRLVCQWQLN